MLRPTHSCLPTSSSRSAVVAGAGGFIGGYLTAELLRRGFAHVRCVDIKPLEEWWQVQPDAENLCLDLRETNAGRVASEGVAEVFNLAADMGGMGFIDNHRAQCMLSVLINTNLLRGALKTGVQRFFFASSACVYPQEKQARVDVEPLAEEDAYPANPEDGYGWEKLFSERMCRHFHEDFGLETRIARFHNIYGPIGTWEGGREKAPAAICRKVSEAILSSDHSILIWGDGEQRRTFTFIDDCIRGILAIHESDHAEPLNLGSDEMVSINELVSCVEELAGVRLERRYDLSAPQGVRGRSSDNSRFERCFGWSPATSLRDGLVPTYEWIHAQVTQRLAESIPAPLPNSCPASSSSISATGRTTPAQHST